MRGLQAWPFVHGTCGDGAMCAGGTGRAGCVAVYAPPSSAVAPDASAPGRAAARPRGRATGHRARHVVQAGIARGSVSVPRRESHRVRDIARRRARAQGRFDRDHGRPVRALQGGVRVRRRAHQRSWDDGEVHQLRASVQDPPNQRRPGCRARSLGRADDRRGVSSSSPPCASCRRRSERARSGAPTR